MDYELSLLPKDVSFIEPCLKVYYVWLNPYDAGKSYTQS